MHRVFEAPNVMNVALADGTSRFADLKSHLALERAKRGQDKAEKKLRKDTLSSLKSAIKDSATD